jgi:deoxyribodipyrimidine photo-lyase
MAALRETGYLNFRMRAMLVSFLCHHLGQPWQNGVHHLAQLFLDYHPGIHYPQFQMQAGVTGINAVRVYNPVKQSQDNDAKSKFICDWLPELKKLPLELRHQPWLLSPLEEKLYNFELGTDYPVPIIDYAEAANKARTKLWEAKKWHAVKHENQRILAKHTTANRSIAVRTKVAMGEK